MSQPFQCCHSRLTRGRCNGRLDLRSWDLLHTNLHRAVLQVELELNIPPLSSKKMEIALQIFVPDSV